MSDFFGEVTKEDCVNKKTKRTKVQSTDKIENLLFSNSNNPDVYVLTDEYLDDDKCSTLYKLLNRVHIQELKKPNNLTIQIIYGFTHLVKKDNIKSQKGWFYYDHSIKLSDYIPNGSKVLTLGDAILFTTSGNTDITIECFLDFILEKTSFYTPLCKSQVFPIYHFSDFVKKDNFERFFTLYNAKKCLDYRVVNKREPILNKIVINSSEELDKLIFDNIGSTDISLDLETTGFDYIEDDIICMTLCLSDNTGYYIDWKLINVDKMNEFLKNKYIVGNNLYFDFRFLIHRGIKDIKIGFDNLQAGHIVNELRSNSLKSQAFYYTNFGDYEKELDIYKRNHKVKNYGEIPRSILKDYAIIDAISSYKVYKELKKELELLDSKVTSNNSKIAEGWGVSSYFYDVVIPANNIFLEKSLTGIKVDWDILSEQEKDLNKLIATTKRELSNLLDVNETFNFDYIDEDKEGSEEANFFDFLQIQETNVDSGEQLGKLLETKGFPEVERNKKKIYTVNTDSLNKWIKSGGFYKEVADKILYLHEINTLQKTFIGGFRKYKNKYDDKIHTFFQVALTNSGRTMSKNPNGQNFPARGWKAEMMKKFFVPYDKDYCWYSIDQSGLQLRLSAMINNDKVFRDVFINQGGDLHSMTGCGVVLNNKVPFNEFIKLKKTDKEVKKARQLAKAINFGLLFGCSAGTLKSTVIETEWTNDDVLNYIKDNKLKIIVDKYGKEDLKLTVAEDIRNKFFKTYKGLKNHIDSTIEQCKTDGYVQSIYGQIRRLPYLLKCDGVDDNMKRVSNYQNISVNTYIQGMEAVNMLRVTIKLYNWLKDNNMKTKIVSQIHDALEIYIHKEEIEQVHKKCLSLFSEYYPEFSNIYLEGEANIADYYLGHNKVYIDKKTKAIKKIEHTNTLWDMGFDVDYYLKCRAEGKLPEVIIEVD